MVKKYCGMLLKQHFHETEVLPLTRMCGVTGPSSAAVHPPDRQISENSKSYIAARPLLAVTK